MLLGVEFTFTLCENFKAHLISPIKLNQRSNRSWWITTIHPSFLESIPQNQRKEKLVSLNILATVKVTKLL